MAGPWYVDPENGLTTNDGLSPGTPWQLIPGQTGATSQTGYAVVAGDIINIKNGTRSSRGRIIFPANNLTYRGYGLAQNTLKLRLPGKNPRDTIITTVVRVEGQHEGLWTLYEPTETNTILVYSTRNGCVVEDVEIIAPSSTSPISMGTSTSTAIGATLKRSRVLSSAFTGITAYTRQITIEDVEIKNIPGDALVIAASSSNSYRAGYPDILRRLSIIEPGTDVGLGVGDAIQTEADSSRFESSLYIEGLYIEKSSEVKQALIFTDILGGLTLKQFHIRSVPDGHAQIMFSGIGGNFLIKDGYIKDGCAGNAVFRYGGLMGIETNTQLTIQNIVVDAPTNTGFFNLGASTDIATVDGAIYIEHCVMAGVNLQNLSYTAAISTHPGANITIGPNASLTARNNCITTSGAPLFRLPTGDANSPKWVFKNNATTNNTFAIGSTIYTSLTEFEAVHNGASNNINSVELLNSNFRPKLNSNLLSAGMFIRVETDIEKKQRQNPPCIGAYEYIPERATAPTRGVR